MKPIDVRKQLVEALELDLIGPEPGSPLASEVLPQSPSRWYLAGFLAPLESDADQRSDASGDDQPDL